MYVNHINIMCKAFLLKKEEEEEIKTQELLKKNKNLKCLQSGETPETSVVLRQPQMVTFFYVLKHSFSAP